MNVYELIKKKRDGLEISAEEINFLVSGFVKGRIPDYQMTAFLMAVYFKGMSIQESCDLTTAMPGKPSIYPKSTVLISINTQPAV
jgi:pyrimidine-nucleoside phosphorylase